jgi:hypothetical protein
MSMDSNAMSIVEVAVVRVAIVRMSIVEMVVVVMKSEKEWRIERPIPAVPIGIPIIIRVIGVTAIRIAISIIGIGGVR